MEETMMSASKTKELAWSSIKRSAKICVEYLNRLCLSVLSLGLLVAGCTGSRPMNLGVQDGKLAPCPASPNCVSSQSSDQVHGIGPLRYTGTSTAAMGQLKVIIIGMKRSRIITDTGSYIHAEFTSALFRFVDDVEFFADERASVIHVRSASRIGSSDLGVNRKRVEDIRAAMTALPPN
jgi:uncharacterized protein (DUF1499 family)